MLREGGSEIRTRLGESGVEVPRVELHQEVALVDVLVVVYVDGADVARYLRGDRDHMGIDKSVVGRLVRPGMKEVTPADHDHHHCRDRHQCQPLRPPIQRPRRSR